MASVAFPEPAAGLVVRYAYLWRREAEAGREEGAKERPCAIILALTDEGERTRVMVLPITHRMPVRVEHAVEIPPPTKARLGLDAERSWIVVTEGNEFLWPGPDLRPVPGASPQSVAHGFIPPRLLRLVQQRFLAHHRRNRSEMVPRTE